MKSFRALALLFFLAVSAQAQTPNTGQGQFPMRQSQSVTIASDQTAIPVSTSLSSSGYSITQTSVAITATSAQIIAANSSRKYLAWMIIGTQNVTCVPGSTAAVAGAGMIYNGSGAGQQGASEEFPHGAPNNAFQCIASAAGSTMYIWEGQ